MNRCFWKVCNISGIFLIGAVLPAAIGLLFRSWIAFFATLIVILSPLSLLKMKLSVEKHKFPEGFLWYGMSILSLIGYFSVIYMETGLLDNSGNLFKNWGSALYFSVVTWTTLGYGDLHPSLAARFWAITEAFIGYIHMAILAGLILALIAKKK